MLPSNLSQVLRSAKHSDILGEEIITGRGASDTKSLSASMLLACLDERLHAEYRKQIGFLFVVSEETTHQGMVKANSFGLNPEYMIVGEPTAGKVIRFQKGMLKVKIHSTGTSAHSGYPYLGESAVSKLLKILHEIEHIVKWPRDDLIETWSDSG